MRLIILLLFFSLPVSQACAETCKYVDKDGHVTYSNVPVHNARRITCLQDAPTPSTDATIPKGAANAAKPEGAPSRQNNNEKRRGQLEEELAREESALLKARAALAEQESLRFGEERNYARLLERLRPFQDAVLSHEQRIASIKQEMANLSDKH